MIEKIKKDSNNSQEELLIEINHERNKQIEKIEEIESENLSQCANINQEKFVLEWEHLLNDVSFSYEQKIDQIKEYYIKSDCILIKRGREETCLFIMPFFVNNLNR